MAAQPPRSLQVDGSMRIHNGYALPDTSFKPISRYLREQRLFSGIHYRLHASNVALGERTDE